MTEPETTGGFDGPSPLPETTRGAVLRELGRALDLVDLDLAPPGEEEVTVRMGATGVCHSDLSVYQGLLPNPLPMVLGHEGAGTVVAVGPGVESVSVGDQVVLSWLAQCSRCFYCRAGQPALCETATRAMVRGTLLDGTTRFSFHGEPVFHMAGLGTFSEFCVVPEKCAIRMDQPIPMESAALLGCGVLTGFGAAVNAGRVRPGESVAVIGCGGVGLNAVQGARISGAETIVAVDLHQERLELARRLGATHTLTPDGALSKTVRQLTHGRGVDVAIEVVGRSEAIRDAVAMTRRGGRIVLVGAGPDDVRLDLPAFGGLVSTEKTIVGSFYGSAQVERDLSVLARLYRSGKLELDALVTRTFSFGDTNEAVAYCADEQGARAVISFADEARPVGPANAGDRGDDD
ncbi:MAG TPA: Zn-dependent alcohol dehydrogenase [Nocardioides sp.]|jgi:alcohol dehydrogenase/S-(hydroxymethyl)glutathione dehydrogenase/alcohol dehydrogenase|uniref:Zn-dependent alcohol dehydrogenase n=1 Tax=Nocardioides sp. TaxID=35761 RepID=UPI002E31895E|nr:Zn-dependent alcohol dehydrogenase [Nocardioides sp.]HEX3930504.1 Zn-dependent alcohol dehydrogenase [Nocardioides sp.]